jgi:hypothetical protein
MPIKLQTRHRWYIQNLQSWLFLPVFSWVMVKTKTKVMMLKILNLLGGPLSSQSDA